MEHLTLRIIGVKQSDKEVCHVPYIDERLRDPTSLDPPQLLDERAAERNNPTITATRHKMWPDREPAGISYRGVGEQTRPARWRSGPFCQLSFPSVDMSSVLVDRSRTENPEPLDSRPSALIEDRAGPTNVDQFERGLAPTERMSTMQDSVDTGEHPSKLVRASQVSFNGGDPDLDPTGISHDGASLPSCRPRGREDMRANEPSGPGQPEHTAHGVAIRRLTVAHSRSLWRMVTA